MLRAIDEQFRYYEVDPCLIDESDVCYSKRRVMKARDWPLAFLALSIIALAVLSVVASVKTWIANGFSFGSLIIFLPLVVIGVIFYIFVRPHMLDGQCRLILMRNAVLYRNKFFCKSVWKFTADELGILTVTVRSPKKCAISFFVRGEEFCIEDLDYTAVRDFACVYTTPNAVKFVFEEMPRQDFVTTGDAADADIAGHIVAAKEEAASRRAKTEDVVIAEFGQTDRSEDDEDDQGCDEYIAAKKKSRFVPKMIAVAVALLIAVGLFVGYGVLNNIGYNWVGTKAEIVSIARDDAEYYIAVSEYTVKGETYTVLISRERIPTSVMDEYNAVALFSYGADQKQEMIVGKTYSLTYNTVDASQVTVGVDHFPLWVMLLMGGIFTFGGLLAFCLMMSGKSYFIGNYGTTLLVAALFLAVGFIYPIRLSVTEKISILDVYVNHFEAPVLLIFGMFGLYFLFSVGGTLCQDIARAAGRKKFCAFTLTERAKLGERGLQSAVAVSDAPKRTLRRKKTV